MVALRHEGIVGTTTGARALEGEGGRKVRRFGRAGHIGAAGRIRGDPKAEVVAAPAEVGRVHEPGPARAELRHEGIVNTKASSVRVLECQGSGEVRRVGKAGHICAAGGIHGDTMTFVLPAPA